VLELRNALAVKFRQLIDGETGQILGELDGIHLLLLRRFAG
jgi:hypothetical protein